MTDMGLTNSIYFDFKFFQPEKRWIWQQKSWRTKWSLPGKRCSSKNKCSQGRSSSWTENSLGLDWEHFEQKDSQTDHVQWCRWLAPGLGSRYFLPWRIFLCHFSYTWQKQAHWRWNCSRYVLHISFVFKTFYKGCSMFWRLMMNWVSQHNQLVFDIRFLKSTHHQSLRKKRTTIHSFEQYMNRNIRRKQCSSIIQRYYFILG